MPASLFAVQMLARPMRKNFKDEIKRFGSALNTQAMKILKESNYWRSNAEFGASAISSLLIDAEIAKH
jgi:hypothetical protein